MRLGRLGLLMLLFALAGCSGGKLTGAGSSFDYPLFSKAFYRYNQLHPAVRIDYQSIGSGGGIEQFTRKTVDFGATDVPMNAAEIARAGGGVVQIPIALGGEAISYNLPALKQTIRLTGPVLARIYLGKIASWSDPAIARLNPRLALPALPIVVVHRSDGSGTTFIFTDYLSTVSPEWKTVVGTGKSVQWPAPGSVGGKGNEGVAGVVTNTPGAIGYIELAYANENHMPAARLQNRAGTWLSPTPASVAAAAAAKPGVTARDSSIVDQPGAHAYPIAGYSWALVYAKQRDPRRGRTLRDALTWLAGPAGQRIAGSLDYVPLPPLVQRLARASLNAVKV